MAFLGQRSSAIVDLYYTLYDVDAKRAMGELTYEAAGENSEESERLKKESSNGHSKERKRR